MELWIRSQDKENLIKVEGILCEKYAISNISAKVYNLIGFTKNNDFTIGTYATKERALEVLDEIEKILHPFVYLDNCIITGSSNGMIYRDKKTNQLIEFSTYVYEMPEE